MNIAIDNFLSFRYLLLHTVSTLVTTIITIEPSPTLKEIPLDYFLLLDTYVYSSETIQNSGFGFSPWEK